MRMNVFVFSRGSIHGALEPLPVERLQEVVHGPDVGPPERLQVAVIEAFRDLRPQSAAWVVGAALRDRRREQRGHAGDEQDQNDRPCAKTHLATIVGGKMYLELSA